MNPATAQMSQMTDPPTMRRFTLKDSSGVVHNYHLLQHPAPEGTPICYMLYAAVASPGIQALGSAAAQPGDGIRGNMLNSVLDAAADLNWGAIGNEVGNAIRQLDMSTFQYQLLRYTHRDGKHLALPAEFSAAFTGNYWELLQAQWEVIKANGFFPPLSTFMTEEGKTEQKATASVRAPES